MEVLFISLGCFGRKDSNERGLPEFISCPAVENRILKVDESLVYFSEIMDYLESLRLFDRPLFDINAIRHFVYNMQERYDQKVKRLWTEKQFQLYEKFIVSHKACGVYVKLVLIDTEQEIKPEVKEHPLDKLLIKGTEELKPRTPQMKLKLIRGKR